MVDDSSLVRTLLSRGLEQFDDISVIATASDPYEARDIIAQAKPDVITLDIEMPKMNGIEFLRHLMNQMPTPVIMVSSLSEKGQAITFDALEYGACDFVTKPQANNPRALSNLIYDLHDKILTASTIPSHRLRIHKNAEVPYALAKPQSTYSFPPDTLVAIGASTGGTEAIKAIVPLLPANFPAVVITQHMPTGFTALFAKRLDSQSAMTVKEASNNDIIEAGSVYIAPGGSQMKITQNRDKKLSIVITDDEPQNGHKPSVGYLYDSLSTINNIPIKAVLLTGMGKDGSHELLSLKKRGVSTIVQDEESSVVFGMPGEAVKIGAASTILPLDKIADVLIQQTKDN